MGYRKVTANQTGITNTVVDLTGMSITFTAVAGRLYRLAAHGWFTSTVNTDTFRLSITDSANGYLMICQDYVNTSTTQSPTCYGFALHTFTAGSTTVKCRAALTSGTGTGTFNAHPTFPAVFTVEDIGPA
jgi:hypothetical protein